MNNTGLVIVGLDPTIQFVAAKSELDHPIKSDNDSDGRRNRSLADVRSARAPEIEPLHTPIARWTPPALPFMSQPK